jgi:uncharacterized phiE125 gp8 family phage protein
MPLVLITPPTAEPVSDIEAAEHLRVEDSDESTHIQGLIATARQYVEDYTWRALVTQTWELALDEFPSGAIVLAKGRLISVTSVKYRDAAGVEQTLDPSAYQVDDVSEPGRALPAPGASWPSTEDGRVNAVRVRFVAGYGDPPAVPGPIKSAMLLIIGHLYEHREMEIVGTISTPLNFAVDALLSPYRMHWV